MSQRSAAEIRGDIRTAKANLLYDLTQNPYAGWAHTISRDRIKELKAELAEAKQREKGQP